MRDDHSTSFPKSFHSELFYDVVFVWLLLSAQVEMIIRNLGLYNAKDTIVGNNDLRGVSGGERRRVTLGE